jgi:hypothetical protein
MELIAVSFVGTVALLIGQAVMLVTAQLRRTYRPILSVPFFREAS